MTPEIETAPLAAEKMAGKTVMRQLPKIPISRGNQIIATGGEDAAKEVEQEEDSIKDAAGEAYASNAQNIYHPSKTSREKLMNCARS